jgi:branched-subunit amino acid transport protein AzlD
MLTNTQAIILIGMASLATILNRSLPFILLNKHRNNKYIVYLGKVLPYSIIGLLMIYSIKDISVMAMPFGLPEIIAIILTAFIHRLFRNNLISIGLGTAIYLMIVNIIL